MRRCAPLPGFASRWATLSWIVIVMLAPGPRALASSDPFPLAEGLRGHVEFWKNVFSVWGPGQVAIHDAKFPEVVYALIDLPGAVGETYTPAQQDYVRSFREELAERLRHLERMVELGAPLTDDEKKLALLITTHAGTDAILGASERLRSQRGIRDRFRRGLEISGRYEKAFREVFRNAGLPEDLAYLPHVESSFQYAARSSAGAVGVWQFTRGAGRIFLNMDSTVDERLDPVAAARGAARYLRKAHSMLGDWALAVTSYNHGMEGMSRAKERFGTDFERIVREYDGRRFGFASRNFYVEFLAAREIAKNPEKFFPEGLRVERPLAHDPVVLDAGTTVHAIARKYGVNVTDLAAINPAWTRRAVQGSRPLRKGTTVWLPEGTLARIATASAPKPQPPAAPAASVTAAPTSASLPRASTAPTRASDGGIHVVKRGETLGAIAARYGVTVATIRRLNGIPESSSTIREGQRLRVRPAQAAAGGAGSAEDTADSPDSLAERLVHIVRSGETLLKIAARHGVSLAELLLENQLSEKSVIHPGQRLVIPGR